jgi:Amt family ammonium transporter
MIIRWREHFVTGDVIFILVGAVVQILIVWPALVLIYNSLSGRRLIANSGYLLPIFTGLSLVWCFWGFSLAFAPAPGTVPQPDPDSPAAVLGSLQEMLAFEESVKDETKSHGRGGLFGGNDYFHFGTQSPVAGSHRPHFPTRRPFYHIPHFLILAFHMMLFIAAPTPLLLMTAGQLRPAGVVTFSIAWGLAIYAPIAHWVWGDGWLESLGVVDSAGGLLQVAIGFSALACAVSLSRHGIFAGSEPAVTGDVQLQSSILNLATLVYWVGTAIVYSVCTMHADGRAVIAFMNTHLAACAGVVTGPIGLLLVGRPIDKSVPCQAVFCALVAIAPACAFVLPETAIIIGGSAALVGCVAVEVLGARQRRAALLPFILYGVPGSIGCLLTGVFATTNVAGLRWDGRSIEGAIEGNLNQIAWQLVGLGAAAAWGFTGTLLIFRGIRLILGSQTNEGAQPLDLSPSLENPATASSAAIPG